MAKEAENLKPTNLPLKGINESSSSFKSDSLAESSGVFPFFYDAYQRMFGKKLIDAYPGKNVWIIHQALNGFGLYGYYVETQDRLYYHQCSSPPDFRIHFVLPQHA